MLIRDSRQFSWFSISRDGEKLVQQYACEEQWENLGVDQVKHDLLNGGFRVVGGPPENREAAWAWVRKKEGKPPIKLFQAVPETSSHLFL